MGREEEIAKIEEEMQKMKYNKATQYHFGLLKAKLARLKEESLIKKSTAGGKAFSVRKTGDATALLVGFPSVGKSTLLNKITSAASKVGDYDFTTLDVIPGIMEYNSAKIQILDIPGVVTGASSGRGRGKEILSVIRNADLLIIMIDKPEQLGVIQRELNDAGFRLNEKRPDVVMKKTERGGIKLSGVRQKHMDEKMIKMVLNERGMHNAEIVVREDLTLDRLIDVTCSNRVYVKAIVIQAKADLLSAEQRKGVQKNIIKVSSFTNEGVAELKKAIWENMDLMRIYMKRLGKPPDMEKPLIVRKGSTVYEIAERIHKEFARNLEYARIWGNSAKFPEQKVGVRHILKDCDVVELHRDRRRHQTI